MNVALLVVGLHSVLFAYLGKDDRQSLYNIVALAGFLAFILMTFTAKLHLRWVHAYVIPTGLCILVLQELFRDRIRPGSANSIRLVTLMAMLGSTGYYALADPEHAITLNLTMIVLCLLAMGLGSWLRIRLYLVLGLAGLLTDLVSLLYKVLVQMEQSARMTVIGTLVLVVGAILVFGAIYCVQNQQDNHRCAYGQMARRLQPLAMTCANTFKQKRQVSTGLGVNQDYGWNLLHTIANFTTMARHCLGGVKRSRSRSTPGTDTANISD